MKTSHILLVVTASLILVSFALAKLLYTHSENRFITPIKNQYFSIAQHPKDFPHATTTLQLLIDTKGNRSIQNNFCIAAQQIDAKSTQAYVYWKEKQAIILWEADMYTPLVDLSLSKRYWDLNKDVVENLNVPGTGADSSTYMETREWWDSTIKNCNTYGSQFAIAPRPIIPDLTKDDIVSKKICSSFNDGNKQKICYRELARQTGDLGYCWQADAPNECMDRVPLERREPGLCLSLHPDSAVGCVEYYESHVQ
jgi:hypothetical protein